MIHLGDIQKISGYTAPIVDCVVGGSPCQDLSVAGKRAGLDGERSGLFMDQIRIIKEMRDKDVRENGRSGVDVRPRYMVWENVPGAFSSNKGEDFRIVLEEVAKVCDKDANVPMPNNGKWQTSGCLLGDGWSIAWRVLDAQFWGVPQRRRRIALVADFGGHSAPEILFVREGVSGHSQPSQPQRKATSTDATRSAGADDIFCIDGDKLNKKERDGGSGMGYREGSQYTLTAKDVPGVAYDSAAYTMKIRSGCDVDANGKAAGKGALIQTEKSGALSCVQDQYLFQPVGADQYNYSILGDSVSTLGVNCGMSQGRRCVLEPVVALDRASYNQGKNAQFDIGISESGTAQSLVAKGHGAVCYSFDPLSSNSMKSSNPNSGFHETDVARTIDTTNPDPSKNQGGVAVVEKVYTIGNGQVDGTDLHEKAGTLNCMHDQQAVMVATYVDTSHADDVVRTDDVVAPLQARDYKGGKLIAAVDCRNGTEDYTNCALQSMASNNINSNNVVRTRYTVRRLTPLECERLQGYPDGWTDIGEYIDSNGKKKQSSDAARYKALGNSIAIPPWKWVMKRLCACYERDATLASLFDGIGGFPLIWEQINGKGSCLWASEIEDFPMAVTKVRIGE